MPPEFPQSLESMAMTANLSEDDRPYFDKLVAAAKQLIGDSPSEKFSLKKMPIEKKRQLSNLMELMRVYLVDKMGMPQALVPAVVFTSSLFVRSRLHANKGVLAARRIPG